MSASFPDSRSPTNPSPADPSAATDGSLAPPPETLTREQAEAAYQFGQQAFERGYYQAAIQQFIQAIAGIKPNSPRGGEIQMWLVNAYAAVHQNQEALALCRQLTRHPDHTTRQQSKRLLFILEAPRLKLRPEWQTKIPDLGAIAAGGEQDKLASVRYAATPKKPRRPRPKPEPEPEDLSQMNTQDNQFIWLSLVAAIAIIGGLVWFG